MDEQATVRPCGLQQGNTRNGIPLPWGVYRYRFVDDPRSDEVELDRTGALSFRKGDILGRDGKLWRVGLVQSEMADENSKKVPTLRVDLTKAWVN